MLAVTRAERRWTRGRKTDTGVRSFLKSVRSVNDFFVRHESHSDEAMEVLEEIKAMKTMRNVFAPLPRVRIPWVWFQGPGVPPTFGPAGGLNVDDSTSANSSKPRQSETSPDPVGNQQFTQEHLLDGVHELLKALEDEESDSDEETARSTPDTEQAHADHMEVDAEAMEVDAGEMEVDA